MKNLKLKWKLLVSYGVIFLFLLILGITSLSVINMISKKSVEYAEEIVPVVEEIGLARRNMISVRRYLLNAMIANNAEDYQRIQDAMNTDREAHMLLWIRLRQPTRTTPLPSMPSGKNYRVYRNTMHKSWS
ncbi:MCP four helix bundle domain-containing protein [Candidatus Avoscillospira sp. LCP25S3_F1]|uniref:MCP four helix bundle domain-containing protein n=1 Tax=Candidatus Avoscillospira sp. LCP25S3_F1 TaxID=3438825 RepID=UPI003F91242A